MARSSGVLWGAFLGGAALYLWQKSRRIGVAPLPRDITRWEDEGGAVTSSPQWADKVADQNDAKNGHVTRVAGTDLSRKPGATPDAWNFPRS